jgi:hypothetical protein
MLCPACSGDRVAFAVPSSLRPYAPDESARAALCTTCLRVTAVDGGEETDADSGDPPPETVEWDPLPTGEAGVATALLVGHLDSLALHRADVVALLDHAEGAGGDPFLALDRLAGLAAAGELDPDVDVERRTAQLQSMVD